MPDVEVHQVGDGDHDGTGHHVDVVVSDVASDVDTLTLVETGFCSEGFSCCYNMWEPF